MTTTNTIEAPFPVTMYDTEPVLVRNPFSGEGVVLEPIAVAVYDVIKGAELLGDWDTVEVGLGWFMTNYPREYMILLD